MQHSNAMMVHADAKNSALGDNFQHPVMIDQHLC
jgi:hypothetical protein